MTERVFFSGFVPNHDLISSAKEWIWKIEEQSPGNSTQKAMITKTPKGFEGYLKVSTMLGQFEVFAESAAAVDIFAALTEKITVRLAQWKKSLKVEAS